MHSCKMFSIQMNEITCLRHKTQSGFLLKKLRQPSIRMNKRFHTSISDTCFQVLMPIAHEKETPFGCKSQPLCIEAIGNRLSLFFFWCKEDLGNLSVSRQQPSTMRNTNTSIIYFQVLMTETHERQTILN